MDKETITIIKKIAKLGTVLLWVAFAVTVIKSLVYTVQHWGQPISSFDFYDVADAIIVLLTSAGIGCLAFYILSICDEISNSIEADFKDDQL